MAQAPSEIFSCVALLMKDAGWKRKDRRWTIVHASAELTFQLEARSWRTATTRRYTPMLSVVYPELSHLFDNFWKSSGLHSRTKSKSVWPHVQVEVELFASLTSDEYRGPYDKFSFENTYDEVGEFFGCAADNVKERVRRIRNDFKKYVFPLADILRSPDATLALYASGKLRWPCFAPYVVWVDLMNERNVLAYERYIRRDK